MSSVAKSHPSKKWITSVFNAFLPAPVNLTYTKPENDKINTITPYLLSLFFNTNTFSFQKCRKQYYRYSGDEINILHMTPCQKQIPLHWLGKLLKCGVLSQAVGQLVMQKKKKKKSAVFLKCWNFTHWNPNAPNPTTHKTLKYHLPIRTFTLRRCWNSRNTTCKRPIFIQLPRTVDFRKPPNGIRIPFPNSKCSLTRACLNLTSKWGSMHLDNLNYPSCQNQLQVVGQTYFGGESDFHEINLQETENPTREPKVGIVYIPFRGGWRKGSKEGVPSSEPAVEKLLTGSRMRRTGVPWLGLRNGPPGLRTLLSELSLCILEESGRRNPEADFPISVATGKEEEMAGVEAGAVLGFNPQKTSY